MPKSYKSHVDILNTVSPLYPQGLHTWVESTGDQKYFKKTPQSSKKKNMAFTLC